MTLEGTNTYLLSDRAEGAIVVDPGPADHPEHVEAILEAVGPREVELILLTHHHRDHRGAAPLLAARTAAPIHAFNATRCAADGTLTNGQELTAAGIRVHVLHTPGHTSDSVCLFLPDHNVMLTGDTVLGRGTTMVDFPDGTLTDYLATLETLAGYPDAALAPAHGPVGATLGPVITQYRTHREERLAQSRQLLDTYGELTAEHLGRLIYGPRPGVREEIITQIAAAQLDHLRTDPR